MLRDAEVAHGIRHVALRYFNAASSDPDGEIGEMHDPETHLIPLVLLAGMGRRPSIRCISRNLIGQLCAWLSDQVLVSVVVRPRSFSTSSSALHLGRPPSWFCARTNVPCEELAACILCFTLPDPPAARRLNDTPFCGTQRDRIR